MKKLIYLKRFESGFKAVLDSQQGQTTVEYMLAIGVIAVIMAAVLMTGGLFEALANLFNELAERVAAPDP